MLLRLRQMTGFSGAASWTAFRRSWPDSFNLLMFAQKRSSQLSEFRLAGGQRVPDLDWPTPAFPAVERRSGRAGCRVRDHPYFWR